MTRSAQIRSAETAYQNAEFECDYVAIATAYAEDAAKAKNKHKYCKWVRLAAKRHLADLKKAKRNKSWGYEFIAWQAGNVCDFIEKLPHVEGEWDTPTIRLEPWQIFILCVIFGWRRVTPGDWGHWPRRFSAVYIECARKNAKSTLAAGVALYCLCCENEVGPQVIIGATTGDQAQKVFHPAHQMAKVTSGLCEEYKLEVMARSIVSNDNGGFIQTINAKSSTQDGWNPHCGILDELHAHKDRGLYDVIKSAFGARKNPLLWIITTAGYDVLGVCFEQRTLVTKILEGSVEADHYFGIIFTLDTAEKEGDPEDDPLDPKVWIKANPNLGVSVSLEQMEGYAIEAENSPDSMGEFKTKRCNIWTTAKAAKFNIEHWKKCVGDVTLDSFEGLDVWGGLDLAAVSDMNAFALVAEHAGRTLLWCRFWLPEDTITSEYVKRRNVPYKRWADEGRLILTPGNVTDYAFIEKDIVEIHKQLGLRCIGYDPWNAQDMVNRLTERNIPMQEFRQGIPSFNAGMRGLERRLNARTALHAGCPILQWHVSNVVARKDVNENEAPDRKNSHEKIDGAVAILMGLAMMVTNEGEKKPDPQIVWFR